MLGASLVLVSLRASFNIPPIIYLIFSAIMIRRNASNQTPHSRATPLSASCLALYLIGASSGTASKSSNILSALRPPFLLSSSFPTSFPVSACPIQVTLGSSLPFRPCPSLKLSSFFHSFKHHFLLPILYPNAPSHSPLFPVLVPRTIASTRILSSILVYRW